MNNLEQTSPPVHQFIELVLQVFPDLTNTLQCPGEGDRFDDCSCYMVPPTHPTHRLYIVTRYNAVEVRYDDGEPPGPAERLFADLDEDPAGVAAGVVEFVRDIIVGNVVVVRERIGRIATLLRTDHCGSLARFERADVVHRHRSTAIVAVYAWRADAGV